MGAAELDYRSIKDIVRGTWSQVWGTMAFNSSSNVLSRTYEFSQGCSEPSTDCGHRLLGN